MLNGKRWGLIGSKILKKSGLILLVQQTGNFWWHFLGICKICVKLHMKKGKYVTFEYSFRNLTTSVCKQKYSTLKILVCICILMIQQHFFNHLAIWEKAEHEIREKEEENIKIRDLTTEGRADSKFGTHLHIYHSCIFFGQKFCNISCCIKVKGKTWKGCKIWVVCVR